MSGLYNMMFGYNIGACLFLATMLTDENPQEFFPRFRDCYLSDDGEYIVVLTRVGGGNRSDGPDDESGYGEHKLYDMPEFVRTWDDSFDSTYGYYEFSVPERWREDFGRVKDGRMGELSDEFIDHVSACYPRLDIRDIIAKASEVVADDCV